MSKLSPSSKGFKLSPQSSPVKDILEILNEQGVNWELSSKSGKVTAKLGKATEKFETLEEAVNWLKEENK